MLHFCEEPILRDILGNIALTRTASMVALKEYLDGWRMLKPRKNIIVAAAYFKLHSGRFTASQSCSLSPQSSSVVHHNHSVAQHVVNLRKWNYQKMTILLGSYELKV